MRIALLSYSTKPRGGVVHTLALAEALAEADQQVTVWTLGRAGDTGFFRTVDPRVRLVIVPFPEVEGEGVGARILRSISILRAAFEPGDYDIVHAQDCISANAFDNCVRTVHHLDQFTTPELAACHERAIVRPFAHVCVSAAVADELARGWGIHAAVIPNGVDAQRFAAAASPAAVSPAAAAARRRWRARLGRYVLAVGGIEPRKGSLELLSAYAMLRGMLGDGMPGDGTLGDAASGLRLVIAGGETLFDYRDYRARWDERAAELGVAPVVLGPVDHDELPALVAAAAVFAFPSAKEGFGLAAMEALAAGVPVVTRELPVLREVFGTAARFAADPAGLAVQLRAALDDPGSHRAAGQALAESYTWEAAATAHLKLYRSLLDRAAPLANAVPLANAALAGPGAKDGPNGPRENITLTTGLPESSSRGWYVQGRRKDAGRG